jgi:predicted Ser/Thr protein kinase
MEEPKGRTEDQETLDGPSLGSLARAGSTPTGPSPAGFVMHGFPVEDWDRYEFLGFLGQGGMGTVFLARDRRLGREVAIKFVRLESEVHLQRFMREARAQALVDHPHICKVFEVGEVEGKAFIAMQRIAGVSLEAAAPELSLEQKALVLRDAALGLHEAHRVGIIHRDLKPSNIMVERGEDGSLRTFVLDFGLAREWDQDVTETGTVLGTAAYMSPEQARGEVSQLDRRTDVYSLGATLYQVVTGRPPFSGANALEILSAIVTGEAPPPRGLVQELPRDLDAIILKCLEGHRSRRYDSAKALAEDLDRYLAGEPVRARPTGFWYRVERRLRKHRQLATLAAVALLVVLLALGVALKTRRDAGLRERLAQHFAESMVRIEAMARYSALSPLHDIRPDQQAVRARMEQLQVEMLQAGSLANGPGHYALGRGYWTLDDTEKAREHLQLAWDSGFRKPEVAYALAVVLGRQYQDRLLEAERLSRADQRAARSREIEASLRAPALALLRQAKGSDVPSPAYLEALMAFYEGNLDGALARLKSVGEELPWFYEASLLRGSLLQARAWRNWNGGKREEALADFETGRLELADAASRGRSAPAVYAAAAELELNALIMEKYGQGRVDPPFQRGMEAVKLALRAQADHVPSLVLEAGLLGHMADFRTDRGEDAEEFLLREVAAAEAALKAGPGRPEAWIALGKAHYQWGNFCQERNQDPTTQLLKGLQALDSLAPEKRDYTVENHLGLIHQTWADWEAQHGRNPLDHLNGAISAYERATRMDPLLLPAWINLGTCLEQRATLPKAANPEQDLETAFRVLDQARILNPQHFVPCFMKGKVLFDLARTRRARGEDPVPYLGRSLEACQEGLSINGNIPQLHNQAGGTLVELAHADWEYGKDPLQHRGQAQAHFRDAIRIAPKQVWGYINLGDLLVWLARSGSERGANQFLKEAEGYLNSALAAASNNPSALAGLGKVDLARAEAALRAGGDPGPSLSRGRVHFAKALAQNPNDGEALQCLGELGLVELRFAMARHGADRMRFDRAEDDFRKAREASSDTQAVDLALLGLLWTKAAWERSMGQDPSKTLSGAMLLAKTLLQARHKWSEVMALQGALFLEEAEGATSPTREERARQATQTFREAVGVNQHLAIRWKSQSDRSRSLAEALR